MELKSVLQFLSSISPMAKNAYNFIANNAYNLFTAPMLLLKSDFSRFPFEIESLKKISFKNGFSAKQTLTDQLFYFYH